MEFDLDAFGIRESLALGVTIALGMILYLSFFPGDPETNAMFLDPVEEENSEEKEEKEKTEEEKEAERLAKIWEEKRNEEMIRDFEARQKRLRDQGVDVEKIRRLLDEAESQEKNASLPISFFVTIVKVMVYAIFVIGGFVLLTIAGVDFSFFPDFLERELKGMKSKL
uniref:Uncharacterized protein n=1 Tax=Aplanochytrium stocchinoi TaxID=215587 RepID=A0A7S3PCS8_9STRA|mmetsp:Transcript_14511/g.17943  ORF Transcript_14511/g.17943 Transcript_14511/m.17943 type:complete len:168 (+) Transcript_14511:59-562(+)|eukprot:CAMPEP_0204822482 /NCGR_PEP_ID=MMETSP1346-20131115/670_1 /ASSEMBLY_ACC=CAM_ASM_000771 /TAXON_ID=215587 /ORGANISM="Aplanochytrium stocchinoi, Strain GSBS06" /LENGTH=167 /DNA_ID=CAMNT_0051948705 /DNA_START=107 /DNA_END=610 /DNA_ORIENTATION=-